MNPCSCGRPLRDTHTVCDTCADKLAQALGDVPWLDTELETTITRQKGIDYRTVGGNKGGRKRGQPEPVHRAAADARTELKTLLTAWVRFCYVHHIRHQSPRHDLPAGDPNSMSRWLMWRVDGLTLHPDGPRAITELTTATDRAQRIIDRPADRQYLGDCGCGGSLYGLPGAAQARCDTCPTRVDADEIRRRLLEQLGDRLYTAAEIARLSTYLGLKANREVVRKRINQWAARGAIVRYPSLTNEHMFQFGEVYARLIRAEYAA